MTASSIPQDFYVYIHRRATDGEIFYVGFGQRRRAWDFQQRGKHWKSIFSKFGCSVEIIQEGLQRWAAVELEKDLIALYGRKDLGLGPLANYTDGGDGTVGKGPEARKAQSERNVRMWKSETYRASRKIKMSDAHRNGAFEHQRQVMREKHNDPDYVMRLELGRNAWNSDPENLAKTKERINALNGDPAFRNKQLAAVSKTVMRSDGVQFPSARAAARATGAKTHTGISNACYSGKVAYGYTWTYV